MCDDSCRDLWFLAVEKLLESLHTINGDHNKTQDGHDANDEGRERFLSVEV
jgi:hypothetical protein